jgi:hypothetical protein
VRNAPSQIKYLTCLPAKFSSLIIAVNFPVSHSSLVAKWKNNFSKLFSSPGFSDSHLSQLKSIARFLIEKYHSLYQKCHFLRKMSRVMPKMRSSLENVSVYISRVRFFPGKNHNLYQKCEFPRKESQFAPKVLWGKYLILVEDGISRGNCHNLYRACDSP